MPEYFVDHPKNNGRVPWLKNGRTGEPLIKLESISDCVLALRLMLTKDAALIASLRRQRARTAIIAADQIVTLGMLERLRAAGLESDALNLDNWHRRLLAAALGDETI